PRKQSAALAGAAGYLTRPGPIGLARPGPPRGATRSSAVGKPNPRREPAAREMLEQARGRLDPDELRSPGNCNSTGVPMAETRTHVPSSGVLRAGSTESGQPGARFRDDQERRWRAGERVRVEAYLDQYPAVRADADAVLDLIYNEI